MSTLLQTRFLEQVLGQDGANALAKATAREASLMDIFLPRTILAWTSIATRVGFEGVIPGTAIEWSVEKSESGYTGTLGEHLFAKESLYHVAALTALCLGVQPKPLEIPESARLEQLGKSIDLMVKTRVALREKEEQLSKKVLDNSGGEYVFSKETEDSRLHPGKGFLNITAKTKDGEHVGYAQFVLHEEGKLYPFLVKVEEAHQRKGIASHMYGLAQSYTGRIVVPSNVQLPDAKALWNGNSKEPQFGDVKKMAQVHPEASIGWRTYGEGDHSDGAWETKPQQVSGFYHHVFTGNPGLVWPDKGGARANISHIFSRSPDVNDEDSQVGHIRGATYGNGPFVVERSRMAPGLANQGHGTNFYNAALVHHGTMRSDDKLSGSSNRVWEKLAAQHGSAVRLGAEGTSEPHEATVKKTDLPGTTAKPIAAGGANAPEPPEKEQARPRPPPIKTPKKNIVPLPKDHVDGMPKIKLPKLPGMK